MKPFMDPRVENVFLAYTPEIRKNLMLLRSIIFDVAADTRGVGEIEETLKWGQPSYLTSQTKSGSTIRIDTYKDEDHYAMYFNCKTTLVDHFKEMYPGEFTYEGNRAIVWNKDEIPARNELEDCIAMALTYHARKRS